MLDIEKSKRLTRDEIRVKAREDIKTLAEKLGSKNFSMASAFEVRLMNLAKKLPPHGKKAYKFLPAGLKSYVAALVDLIAQEPEILNLYEKWKSYQVDLTRFYKSGDDFNFPKCNIKYF